MVTFAFRTVPYRLKIKLLGEPGQAEEMAAHRLRENEWILPVRAPPGRCLDLGRGMGMESLKLCRPVTQVESWRGAGSKWFMLGKWWECSFLMPEMQE